MYFRLCFVSGICHEQLFIAILNSLAIYLLFGFNEKFYDILCKYPTYVCYFCVVGKESAILSSKNQSLVMTRTPTDVSITHHQSINKKSNKEMQELEVYVDN